MTKQGARGLYNHSGGQQLDSRLCNKAGRTASDSVPCKEGCTSGSTAKQWPECVGRLKSAANTHRRQPVSGVHKYCRRRVPNQTHSSAGCWAELLQCRLYVDPMPSRACCLLGCYM